VEGLTPVCSAAVLARYTLPHTGGRNLSLETDPLCSQWVTPFPKEIALAVVATHQAGVNLWTCNRGRRAPPKPHGSLRRSSGDAPAKLRRNSGEDTGL
jgi:hypothetical protein